MPVFDDVEATLDMKIRVEGMLPDFALEKAALVSSIAEKRTAEVQALNARNTKERQRIKEYQADIDRTNYQINYEGYVRSNDSDAFIAKLEGLISKLKSECAKRDEHIKQQAPTIPPFIIFDFLRELPRNTKFNDARTPVAQTTDPRRALALSREKINELIKQRAARRGARTTEEEAIAKACADIDRKAGSGPDFARVSLISQLTGRPEKPKYQMEYLSNGVEKIDSAALVFYLFKDQLKTLAKDQLRTIYRAKPLVIPQNERLAKIAEIDAKILDESRIEEALVEIHEAQGLDVVRRPKAHPLAILGVAIDDSPEPKDADTHAESDDDFG